MKRQVVAGKYPLHSVMAAEHVDGSRVIPLEQNRGTILGFLKSNAYPVVVFATNIQAARSWRDGKTHLGNFKSIFEADMSIDMYDCVPGTTFTITYPNGTTVERVLSAKKLYELVASDKTFVYAYEKDDTRRTEQKNLVIRYKFPFAPDVQIAGVHSPDRVENVTEHQARWLCQCDVEFVAYRPDQEPKAAKPFSSVTEAIRKYFNTNGLISELDPHASLYVFFPGNDEAIRSFRENKVTVSLVEPGLEHSPRCFSNTQECATYYVALGYEVRGYVYVDKEETA